MDYKSVIGLFLLLAFCVRSFHSHPSPFGDEFVHIKVHVPTEIASTHGTLHSTYPGSPQYPHTSHKVIHHYHNRRKHLRRPSSPSAKGPVLESFILADFDKSSAEEEPAVIEESFVVKEIPNEPKVNTYQVIEETIPKPPAHQEKVENVETLQIIEKNKEHTKIEPHYKGSEHVESVKFVTETKNFNQDEINEPHVKTVEVVKETKSYGPIKHQHENVHEIQHPQEKPQKETLEIIETSVKQSDDNDCDGQNHHHRHHHHHQEHNYHTPHDSGESEYHNYKTPHIESVEIIKKAKKIPVHIQSENHSFKHFEKDGGSEEYHPHGYHKDTVEIVQAKSLPKYHHHSSEYKDQDHFSFKHQEYRDQDHLNFKHPKKEINDVGNDKRYLPPPREERDHLYFKHPKKEINDVGNDKRYLPPPREEFDYQKWNRNPAHNYHSEKSKILIEHHKHYESPTPEVYHPKYHISAASVHSGEHKDHKRVHPKRLQRPHPVYGSEEAFEREQHQYLPSHADRGIQSHYLEAAQPKAKQSSYHYPRPQENSHLYSVYQRDAINLPSHGYEVYENNKFDSEAPESYGSPSNTVGYYAYPPTATTDSNSKLQRTLKPQQSQSSYRQDNISKFLPPIDDVSSSIRSHIDWPDGVGKSESVDSYEGYDSYRADHVQGVGSGVYHYPPN